ncbi:hypothetical protein ACTNDN_15205 [Niallia sp. HCP3S3_B10]
MQSRDKDDVVAWLAEFPNLKYVSRDGFHTYASAIRESHPKSTSVIDFI